MRKFSNAIQNYYGTLNVTAPAATNALTINSAAGQDAIDINLSQSAGLGFAMNVAGASAADVRGIFITNSTNSTTSGTNGLNISNSAGQTLSLWVNSTSFVGPRFSGQAGGAQGIIISGGMPTSFVGGTANAEYMRANLTGNITMNPATTGTTLAVTGGSGGGGNFCASFQATTSGMSQGILIKAGIVSTDNIILAANAASTKTYFVLSGDGSFSLGAGTTAPFNGDAGGNANIGSSFNFLAIPTQTTSPSAGGAGALPATPAGYLIIGVNGTNRRLAFY